jgi:hypothetical protein
VTEASWTAKNTRLRSLNDDYWVCQRPHFGDVFMWEKEKWAKRMSGGGAGREKDDVAHTLGVVHLVKKVK